MNIFGIMFWCGIILIPYLACLTLLMVIRALTPLCAVRFGISLAAAVGLSVLIVGGTTLFLGINAIDLSLGFLGILMKALPFLTVLLLAFLLPNLRSFIEDEKRVIRKKATVISVALTAAVLLAGVMVINRFPPVRVGEGCEAFMTEERVDRVRRKAAASALRQGTFVTGIYVDRAGEDFEQVIVSKYMSGRIGVTTYYDQNGEPCGGELFEP